MSDACGCGGDEPRPTDGATGHARADSDAGTTRAEGGAGSEPLALWQVGEIRFAALAGVLLAAGYGTAWAGGPAPVALALQALALAAGAWTFVPGTLRRLARGRIGVGTLMTIAAAGAVALGEVGEAAMLAFLYSIAEGLEEYSVARARRGLRALLDLVPARATVLRDGAEHAVTPAELRVGDTMVVRPGERLATDGRVVSGRTALDVSAITGESVRVEAGPGDTVYAGSINGTGALEVTVTAAAEDNTLARVVAIVEAEQARKGASQRLADRVARPLVPGVMAVAALVAVVGSLLGEPAVWVERALVVLVAASPCALAISVPVTVVAAIGAASRQGALVKGGAALEALGRVRTVALDKTGTLTRNDPTVVEVVPAPGRTRAEVLAVAAALEARSEHPLARAILAAAAGGQQAIVDAAVEAPTAGDASAGDEPAGTANAVGGDVPADLALRAGPVVPTDPALPAGAAAARTVAEDVTAVPGAGLTGRISGRPVRLGRPDWVDAGPLAPAVARMLDAGATTVLVEDDGVPLGAIAVRDEPRPESREVVAELGRHGYAVAMLTGDNAATARALAAETGIATVHARLRPEDKARIVAELRAGGAVAMVGDGVNDAPALASADVGVAMGAMGTDVAIETADVALMGENLGHLPRVLSHARRATAIMWQNIALSLVLITVLLPLALFGVLGLAAVVLVHEVAEVVVIANGIRAGRARAAPEVEGGSPSVTTRERPSSVPAG